MPGRTHGQPAVTWLEIEPRKAARFLVKEGESTTGGARSVCGPAASRVALWPKFNPLTDMKIRISKKEYRSLLDLISIATYVLDFHHEDDGKLSPYIKLEQELLAYGADAGYGDLVAFDRKTQSFYLSRKYEEEDTDQPFIEEFEDRFFWEELCTRLAQRDMLKEKGAQRLADMEETQRLTEEDQIAERYFNEFIKNGLDNLILFKD